MAIDVTTRFRQWIPGVGYDSSGDAKQGKSRVVGVISVTSYTGGAGEPLTAVDLGLSTIDSLQLRVRNQVPSGDGKHSREAVYADDTERFYLVDVDAQGDRTHFAAGDAASVEFDAFGDSAGDVELT